MTYKGKCLQDILRIGWHLFYVNVLLMKHGQLLHALSLVNCHCIMTTKKLCTSGSADPGFVTPSQMQIYNHFNEQYAEFLSFLQISILNSRGDRSTVEAKIQELVRNIFAVNLKRNSKFSSISSPFRKCGVVAPDLACATKVYLPETVLITARSTIILSMKRTAGYGRTEGYGILGRETGGKNERLEAEIITEVGIA